MHSAYDPVAYVNPVKTAARLSRSIKSKGINQSHCSIPGLVIGCFFCLTASKYDNLVFTGLLKGQSRNLKWKKWKRSDFFFYFDSVELMTRSAYSSDF